jgi:hypothetical protein
VAEAPKNVAAGLSAAGRTVGLTGLVPLAVIDVPPVSVRAADGKLRMHLELDAGDGLVEGRPVLLRIYGGDAGMSVEGGGRIVQLTQVQLPIEIAYQSREIPAPPPQGQVSVDLSFWHRQGEREVAQDVQWRIPVTWAKNGARSIELRFPAQQ